MLKFSKLINLYEKEQWTNLIISTQRIYVNKKNVNINTGGMNTTNVKIDTWDSIDYEINMD